MAGAKIKVQLLSKDAKAPSYAHEGDAGLDLCSPYKVKLKPGEKTIIDTKVVIELPKDTVGLIWDKSGMACLNGIKVLGGVFDSGYRGSYTVGLINLSRKTYTIEVGDKICQLLIQPIVTVDVKIVDKIDVKTSRKGGRFGSSGRK